MLRRNSKFEGIISQYVVNQGWLRDLSKKELLWQHSSVEFRATTSNFGNKERIWIVYEWNDIFVIKNLLV